MALSTGFDSVQDHLVASHGELTEIVADHRWLLVGVGSEYDFVEIRPSPGEAWLDLHGDGEVGYFDTVNFHHGRFEITAAGLVLSDVSTTLVGYAGHDRQVLATLTAFAKVSATSSHRAPANDGRDHSGEQGAARAVVGLRVVDWLLALDVAGSRLLFRRAGRLRH